MQAKIAELQQGRGAFFRAQDEWQVLKEQQMALMRDIQRYQTTQVEKNDEIGRLGSQLIEEKTRSTDATRQAAANQVLLDVERRNYSSVQDLLTAARFHVYDLEEKLSTSMSEQDLLKSKLAAFGEQDDELKALQRNYLHAKAQVEGLEAQLAARDEVMKEHLGTIEMLQNAPSGWNILQDNYAAVKATHERTMKEKAGLEVALAQAHQKISAFEDGLESSV